MTSSAPEIGFPLEISINLTGACGLDCTYCYAQPFSKQFIPYEKVINILDLAKERGAFVIKIAGGEPLLHPQFNRILDYIVSEEINLAILSSLAVPRKIALKTAKTINGVNSINFQVSLDSIRPEVNDVARGKTGLVLSNIELFLNRKIDLQIASVIADHNIDYLIEIVEKYYPRTKKFHFMNVMPSIKVSSKNKMVSLTPHSKKKREFWRQLLTRYGRKIITNPPTAKECKENQKFHFQGCSAGHLFCVIDSTLDVLACNMAKTFVLGNLETNTFDEIWNSNEAAKIRHATVPLCHTYVSHETKDELAHNKALHLTASSPLSE